MSEPEKCPNCGRYAEVWPSTSIDGWICWDLWFHGFTGGERGTIAALYQGMRQLSMQLRGQKMPNEPLKSTTAEGTRDPAK